MPSPKPTEQSIKVDYGVASLQKYPVQQRALKDTSESLTASIKQKALLSVFLQGTSSNIEQRKIKYKAKNISKKCKNIGVYQCCI